MTPGSQHAAWWTTLPLATLNVKDFADFTEYEGLTIV
jgi:hypothetical protein